MGKVGLILSQNCDLTVTVRSRLEYIVQSYHEILHRFVTCAPLS